MAATLASCDSASWPDRMALGSGDRNVIRYAVCSHCRAKIRIDTDEGASHVMLHEPKGSYAERKRRRVERERRKAKYASVAYA